MSNIRVEPSPDETRLILEGRLDIRNASQLQKHLCEALAAESPLVIDCVAAEWLDTACMQLLLAAHKSAPGRVTVKLASEGSVQHWMHTSGFAAHLALAQ